MIHAYDAESVLKINWGYNALTLRKQWVWMGMSIAMIGLVVNVGITILVPYHSISNHCNHLKVDCKWMISTGDQPSDELQAMMRLQIGAEKNGWHFVDDIFRVIFVDENCHILISISLKYVPKSPIDNTPTLVQIMAWRQTSKKPLSESLMAEFGDAYMSHSASMS